MDRGAWRATVHGVAKSRTRLRQVGTCAELIYSVVPVSEEVEKGYRQGMLILQKETRNYKEESRKVRIFICRDKS